MPITYPGLTSLLPRWIAGQIYGVHDLKGGSTTTAALTANRIYASPIYVPAGGRIDRIGIQVTSAATGGSVARLMLFSATGTELPDVLLLDGGTVAVDGLGEKTVTVDYTPPPGIIMAAVVSDGAPTLRCTNGTQGLSGSGAAAFGANNWNNSPYKNNGSTTAPNPFGSITGYSSSLWIQIDVRAV